MLPDAAINAQINALYEQDEQAQQHYDAHHIQNNKPEEQPINIPQYTDLRKVETLDVIDM